MAGLNIKFNSRALAQIQQYSAGLEDGLKDFRKPFRRIAKEVLQPRARESFKAKKGPGGEAWKSADPLYALLKKRKGKSPKRLGELTGDLRKSLTGGPSRPGAIRVFRKLLMIYGTEVVYASTFQWGRLALGRKPGKISKGLVKPTKGRGRQSKRRKAELDAQKKKGWPPRRIIYFDDKTTADALAILFGHIDTLFDEQARGASSRGA